MAADASAFFATRSSEGKVSGVSNKRVFVVHEERFWSSENAKDDMMESIWNNIIP